MLRRLLTAASAVTLSLALMAPVHAQDLGLKQLQDSAVSSLAQLGMDTSMVERLTLEELAQIQSVTGGGDPESVKVQRIETIFRDAEERIAAGGAVEPSGPAGDLTTQDLAGDAVVKANVGAYLAQLGLASEVDVDTLTTDELLQVQLVQGSTDSEDEQRAKIEALLAD